MISSLYSFFIFLYGLSFRIASFWNPKAKKRIAGLDAQSFTSIPSGAILIHCASMGEYEQGRPIIDWILQNTSHNICISFFSSSGYEGTKLDNDRCQKIYFPFDSIVQMRKLLDNLQPIKIILIKNEWWWNFIKIAASKKIPIFQVAATIRSNHYFVKYPISFFKSRLESLKTIFTIDKSSSENLKQSYDVDARITGDTRIDQVMKLKTSNTIQRRNKAIVYGSVWPSDIEIINESIKQYPNHYHFVFPHELDENTLSQFNQRIANSVLSNDTVFANDTIQIISQMGILKERYALANLAYIGGGFSAGIHNILEAAVYNIPTIFGPKYSKSKEAIHLVDCQLAFSISSKSELGEIKKYMETHEAEIATNLENYFKSNSNNVDVICEAIFSDDKTP